MSPIFRIEGKNLDRQRLFNFQLKKNYKNSLKIIYFLFLKLALLLLSFQQAKGMAVVLIPWDLMRIKTL